MFAHHMFSDERHNRSDRGSSVANPKWSHVRAAITAIDGRQRTMVSLMDKEGGNHYMIIAGFYDGRYLVHYTKDNLSFFSLFDHEQPKDKVTLFIGGQDGEYQLQQLVDKSWAEDAARFFLRTGEMKPGMNWKCDH